MLEFMPVLSTLIWTEISQAGDWKSEVSFVQKLTHFNLHPQFSNCFVIFVEALRFSRENLKLNSYYLFRK